MRTHATKPFPWFVGVHSLEELATKDSRVCVINILGSESRGVTPVSHEYSGGNVVAGVQYGRRGVLETKLGDIPVYRSVREVLADGHAFDVGVVYLPPLGVAQAVSELVRTNEGLKRIVIVTEKVPARDSAAVRALSQEAGVDVIGANSLGVANAWDHVRIGGSLGGDTPEEALRKGSIAIHSNSGNFTTTMSEYLRTAGFGISTAVSSGKDVYIHFALPEFLWAAQNDPRTKAVVLYVEPGGYYERIALDFVLERRFGFTKPIVCCVTGRWRKEVTRTCGHAGALAGNGEDAESKERWFDDYFGVPVFDPKAPLVGRRGVRVSSIQFVPDAIRAVFEKMGEAPDFDSTGDLSLKPWLGDNVVPLPPDLAVPTVRALAPYDRQIMAITKEVGAHYLRQNMSDKSGASRMGRKTQIAELHQKTVLDLSQRVMEENLYFALAKVMPSSEDVATVNLLMNLFLATDERRVEAVDVARANGALPNAYLASRLALMGDEPMLAGAREKARFLVDVIREFAVDERIELVPAGAGRVREGAPALRGRSGAPVADLRPPPLGGEEEPEALRRPPGEPARDRARGAREARDPRRARVPARHARRLRLLEADAREAHDAPGRRGRDRLPRLRRADRLLLGARPRAQPALEEARGGEALQPRRELHRQRLQDPVRPRAGSSRS